MGRVGWTWAVLVLCAACARGAGIGATGPPGFSITYPEAPPTGVTIHRGKRYYAKPTAQCFYEYGREARWTMSGAQVTSGELPPGLTLEDGVIGGVPTTAGTYRATIELGNVTCAGKPYPGQTVDISITVK